MDNIGQFPGNDIIYTVMSTEDIENDGIFQGCDGDLIFLENVTILSTHFLAVFSAPKSVQKKKNLPEKETGLISVILCGNFSLTIKSPFEFKLSHKLLGCQKYFSCK